MLNVYTSQKDRIEGGSIGIKLYAYESWQKKETLPLQQSVSGVYKSVDTHQSIHAFKKSVYIYIYIYILRPKMTALRCISG